MGHAFVKDFFGGLLNIFGSHAGRWVIRMDFFYEYVVDSVAFQFCLEISEWIILFSIRIGEISDELCKFIIIQARFETDGANFLFFEFIGQEFKVMKNNVFSWN
jgi:hypothetical protein